MHRGLMMFGLALAPGSALADPVDCDPEPPQLAVGFDLLPWVGTSSSASGRCAGRHISLALIGGLAGGVEGVDLSTLFSVVSRDVDGVQLSSGAGIVGEDLHGVQLAVGAGIVGENVYGVQLAAGATIVGGEATGLVGAAGATIVGEDLHGVAAGVVNITGGDVQGLQLGVVNVDGGRVHGVQLGVVNIASDSDLSIGVVSIIADGRTHVDVWGSETGYAFTSFKHGGRFFHNTYTVGVSPFGDGWASGLGLGGHLPLGERWFTDVDLLATALYREQAWRQSDALLTARAIVGFHLSPFVAVFAGPAYTLQVTGGREALVGHARPLTAGGDDWTWPGVHVGVQLLRVPVPGAEADT